MNDAASTLPGSTEGASAPMPKRRSPRAIILPVVLIVVLGSLGLWFFNYWTHGRFLISTDDAYVGAAVSTISTRVSGHVVTVAVVNNQSVKAGDLLAKIDDGDYRLAVESASRKIETQNASLARLDSQSLQQNATVAQARAQIAAAEADAQRAQGDFDRAQTLAAADFNSRAKLDQVRADRDRTQAALQSARAGLTAAEAGLDVLKAQKSELTSSKSELETALSRTTRDLSFTEIRAPFDGVIGNKAIQLGQFVQPGMRLLALVPLESAYVDANLKETQIAPLKIGMRAEIRADAFPGRVFEGRVESLSPATGAQFSLLPPENATGNFTKVVQRVPVRISLPDDLKREQILRPGMSVTVEIDPTKP
jgi:membrane fusion protein, multidrug efflux system